MPSTDELNTRLQTVEGIIANAVVIPNYVVDIDNTSIADKTGMWVIGNGKVGIHSGARFLGKSSVANPTLTAHFSTFLMVT